MNAPIRWKEQGSGATPELRAVLDYAATRTPDAAYVTALTGAVLSQIVLPLPPPALGIATGKSALALSSSKLLGLVLTASVASATGVYVYVANEPAARPAQHASATIEARATAVTEPESPGEPAAEVAAAPVREEEPPAQAVAASTQRKAREVGQPRAREHEPVDELQLLHAARVARRTSEPRALSLLRQHERDFPDSSFREEREALLIELLLRANPREAAQRMADFIARYPHSAYREHLESGGDAQVP
jgi:hypothetical protein